MSKKDSENVCFWLPNQAAGKMDVLTPHKMIVVFLIQEYLRLKKTVSEGVVASGEQSQQIEVSAGDRKRFCMLLLKLIQYPDLPYKDLYGLLLSPVYGVHPVHLEEFKKLMKLLKTVGIDVMFDLYNEIDKLIMDNTASFQIGIVGLYLRKVFVTMDRMSFYEMKDLYLATIAYYDKGMHAIRLDPCPEASYDAESFKQATNQYTPIEPSDHGTHAAKWSVKQSELFIAQQSALLKENEAKALPPKELQKRLNEIIHDRPHCSQAYFLNYMNNVRVREFFGAVHALQRVFDRTPSAGAPPGATNGGGTSEGKDYQYASLNLAILHAEFGHPELARVCLRECIMIAQENADPTCLQLAHAWLSHLEGHCMPLPDKTTSGSLFHATSLHILSHLRQGSIIGKKPSELFGLLMVNDLLNCQRSMMDLVATGIAERTALWTVYGKHEQASLCAQLLLNVELKSLDKKYNGNGVCQVLCSLVVRLAHLGEFGLALVVLQYTKGNFPRYPQSRDWHLADHYVSVLRAIYRGRWAEASGECQHLHSYDPHLALLQFAHIALAKQDYSTAEDFIARLLDDETLVPLVRIRAMLLSANVYIHNGQPKAFQLLNSAQMYAQRYHLQYEEALVHLHFAYLLLTHLHAPRQAFVSIKAALETILANGPIYDRARALFLFARTLVELERHEPGAARLNQLNAMLPTFEQAVEMFEKLECYCKAKDVYVYLAQTYHELGSTEERNRYSYRYRLLEEQYPTERQYLNVFL
uniref:Anaphase-promoting complex subunit 5 n=1 Tax=Anopheles epiroticus TaxID=199890 RepID=A0A182PHG8_9DIPT